jgi:hypothetical protein
MDLIVLEVNHAAVGPARAAGCAAALDGLAGLADEQIWLATTDADSEVPFDWLAYQTGGHAEGVGGWAGTVQVAEWDEQPAGAREWFDRLYRNDRRHVHGANLGFTAAAYRDIGGFAGLACSEDHALYEALGQAGHRVVADGNAPVLTSARREGRAPGGFSDTLRGYGRRVDGPDGGSVIRVRSG